MTSLEVVTPVKIGVQMVCNYLKILDSGFRRNDGEWGFSTFYKTITIRVKKKPFVPLKIIKKDFLQ